MDKVVDNKRESSPEDTHVEITLSMPSKTRSRSRSRAGTGSSVTAGHGENDAMDWAPTPSSSQQAPPSPTSSVPASPHLDTTMSDASHDPGADADSDDSPRLSIKSLPRRAREATTPPTSVSPAAAPAVVTENAEDIIARMKAQASTRRPVVSSDEDEDTKTNAIAKALLEDSSDGDDEDMEDAPGGLFGSGLGRSKSNAQTSSS